MQLTWPMTGLRTGILTTGYPARAESLSPGWRGRPVLDPRACYAADGCAACTTVCLPHALHVESPGETARDARERHFVLDYGRCIMCGLCVQACPAGALQIQPDYELAVRAAEDLRVSLRWVEEGDMSNDER